MPIKRRKKFVPKFASGDKVVFIDDDESRKTWTVTNADCSCDGIDHCVAIITEIEGEPYTMTTLPWCLEKV